MSTDPSFRMAVEYVFQPRPAQRRDDGKGLIKAENRR